MAKQAKYQWFGKIQIMRFLYWFKFIFIQFNYFKGNFRLCFFLVEAMFGVLQVYIHLKNNQANLADLKCYDKWLFWGKCERLRNSMCHC